MTQPSAPGRRSWRSLAMLLGTLLTGGLLIQAVPAQQKTPPKSTAPARPTPARPHLITLPSGTSSDVGEVVELINTKLEEGWKENKLEPSRPTTDYEFIRRASLDIIGRIATAKEIEEFQRMPARYRRSMLIDKLLASPEYARHWANLWSNWLLTRSGPFGRGEYHEQLTTWLEEQFALNKPYNEIVTRLVTAKGKNTENPEVNFILAHVGEPVPAAKRQSDGYFEMVPITSRMTRLFLGVQTQCTQCHDHPFDANLKQTHFWGVNAYLRQINRQGTPPMVGQRVQTRVPLTLVEDDNVNRNAVVVYEKRNGVIMETKAQFIDGTKLASDVKSRREELAKLMVAHDNFPRVAVNRMWSVFFGKGFCNPVDDFNEQNQITNPELLNEVAKKYRHYGFDQKKLIRWICNSEAYQLSCVANKTNDATDKEVFFSRMILKSMSPEQLLESLLTATGSQQGKDARKQLRDRWMNNLVANFGDDEGNEVNFNGTIVQALLMMNGTDINSAINDANGTVATTLKNSRSFAARVNTLYLAALNRPATAAEVRRIAEKMRLRPQFADKSEAPPFQDLFWALLNSNEFLLNH